MCGLSCYISCAPQPASLIRAMTDVIAHRGPDDEGFALFQFPDSVPIVLGGKATPEASYRAGHAFSPQHPIAEKNEARMSMAFGHRRLAIVDVSPAGHQPMCTPDHRFWIVYNGEVYNYIELRAELEQLGYIFHSHSDTEIILASYQEWGQGCLSRFNGMFAFLIYDRKNNMLFAARDRFGVKPLYYWVSAHGIAFASEIKQFTVLSGWEARMNGQRAYDFLNWGITDHTDETLFAGVYQLRGGQALEINVPQVLDGCIGFSAGKQLPVYDWYQLKPQPFIGTMQEASEQFREKLIESVRLQLRADVPVGSCLSGGLDSSSIVCIANQLLHEQNAHGLQKTFSACAEEAKYDERKWIDIVVNATDVDAHYVYPPLSGLFEESANIAWHQDEPFGSTSIYAQWKVFGLAAEQRVKVMLDGQGADEQLAGYHGFFGPHLGTLLRSGRIPTMLKEASAMKKLHGYSFARSAVYLANAILPEWLKGLLRKLTGRTTAQSAWLNYHRLNCKTINPFVAGGAAGAQSVQTFSIAQLTASNLQMLLHWEDRDSMAHSIESRVPFLDHRLVEFMLGLPDEYKLSEGITKRILRQGMSGILPNEIRDRMDKKGFETPEEIWLRETAPDLFRMKLGDAINVSQGVLHREESLRILEEMIAGERPFSFLPWRMISFGEWVKSFGVAV